MEFTREYIGIGGFVIYWYGVLIATGALLALFIASKREKSHGIKEGTMLDTALAALPAGVIGARAYYVLMRPDEFHSFSDVINVRGGGLAIYGGLILGIFAGFVCSRVKKQSFIAMFDAAAPGIALAQAIGRWGNFLNREAFGVPVTDSALQFFPFAVYIPGSGYHAATFFYESLWCFVIFLLLTLGHRKTLKRGTASLTYLIMYACERCAVEGLRMDSLYIGTVRASQMLSAVILVCAAVYLLKGRPIAVVSGALLIASVLFMPLYVTLVLALAVTALCLKALWTV